MKVVHYLWAISTLWYFFTMEYAYCPIFYQIQSVDKNDISNRQINKTFTGSGYNIEIPNDWEVKELDATQVYIKGVKVNNAYAALYITKVPKNGKNYLDASTSIKINQSKKLNYKTIEEKDISKSELNAFLRCSSWHSSRINMELFVREIYTENDTHIFILSASIPVTTNTETLDKLMVSILNTFKFL